jgi:hypothetical protein
MPATKGSAASSRASPRCASPSTKVKEEKLDENTEQHSPSPGFGSVSTPPPSKKSQKNSATRRKLISSSVFFGAFALLVPALCVTEIYIVWVRPCVAIPEESSHCAMSAASQYHKLWPLAPAFIFAIASSLITLAATAIHFAARLSARYSSSSSPPALVIGILGLHVLSGACLVLLTNAAMKAEYLSQMLGMSLLAIGSVYMMYFAVVLCISVS